MTTSTAEIPVWVNGLQKWITGLTRKTTCQDIIKALLHAEGKTEELKDSEIHCYAIVERWRKVERPLDNKSRILKVWTTWGDQKEVKFTLRKVSPVTPKDVKQSRKKHERREHWRHSSISSRNRTIHPRRLHDSEDTRLTSDSMEKLMKLILVQGETIQSQLKKLQVQEDQIDIYEHKIHEMRSDKLGSNYLLDTYLGAEVSEEQSNDSGVIVVTDIREKLRVRTSNNDSTCSSDVAVSSPSPEATFEGYSPSPTSEESSLSRPPEDDIDAKVSLMQRIVELNDKITLEEEKLVQLTSKINSSGEINSSTKEVSEGSVPLETEDLNRKLEAAKKDLEKISITTANQDLEIERNDLKIHEVSRHLEERCQYFRALLYDLDTAEKEGLRIRNHLDVLQSFNPQLLQQTVVTTKSCLKDVNYRNVATPKLSTGKDFNDTDSTSDTGLSSLHSSIEEGVYVLDTLV